MRKILLSCVAAVFAAGSTAQTVADRENSTPTAAIWLSNQTPAQIQTLAGQGWRLTEIEISSTSPWSFTVAMVANTGSYQTNWAWYYDITPTALGAALTQNQARLIDIEPYDAGGQTRFAAIMVDNTGANARSWGWLYDTTTTAITQNVNQFNNRVVDLERYSRGGTTHYAAILTSNTGAQARAWWLGFGLSPTQLAQQLQQNAAQIVDLVRNGSNYDVVMQQVPGSTGWWYGLGLSAQGVTSALGQNGARAIDIEPYATLFGTRYDVVMVNNSNALTTQVGNILRSGTDGVSGCLLREIGGPVLASLQSEVPFEPASTIKVLFHAHALRQIQSGNASLSTSIAVPFVVSGGCYQWNFTNNHPLGYSLQQMMQVSNNDHTIGVQGHFTNAAIQQTATNPLTGLGMSDTVLSRFDCQGPLNESTLVDFGRLYERVHHGWLNQTNLDRFHDLMLTDFGMGNTNLGPVVDQEAAALSLPANVATQFKSRIGAAWKDGNYDRGTVHHVSICGWISLPFRTNGQVTPREYVTGTFVDLATDNHAAAVALYLAQQTLLRGPIRDALQTWTNYTAPTVQFYGTECSGPTTSPRIRLTGSPMQIGATVDFRLESAPPGAFAIGIAGLSNTQNGATPLPLSLAGFGAPACHLYASVDAPVWRTTDASGAAVYSFAVPYAPTLLGLPLYGQWLVHDIGANAAGLTATGGARVTLGGFQ